MNGELVQNSTNLLTCFFTECENAFNFLEHEYHYKPLSGLVDCIRGRLVIKPYFKQPVKNTFNATVRYETENHAIELFYGDKSFSIEPYVHYNRSYRLSFDDVLPPADNGKLTTHNTQWVTQESRVRKVIQDVSLTLRQNRQNFFKGDKKMIEQALAARARRIELAVREQHKKDLDQAVRLAAKAFLNKNFQRVIELLLPYERHLSVMDKKKLRIACNQLLIRH